MAHIGPITITPIIKASITIAPIILTPKKSLYYPYIAPILPLYSPYIEEACKMISETQDCRDVPRWTRSIGRNVHRQGLVAVQDECSERIPRSAAQSL